MEKYEQPGERLHSKVPSDEYKEAYDRIFGKKQYWYEKKQQEYEPRFGYPICDKCRDISPVERNHREICKEFHCSWYEKKLEKEKDETSETPVQTD